MDSHVLEYYHAYTEDAPYGQFYRVIALHDEPLLNWQEAHQLAPNLPRAWYELATLKSVDRIEFLRDFWLSKLSYHPHMTESLINFFNSLDDIGIFLMQKQKEDLFQCHLVYSLAKNSGFFYGAPPAKIDNKNINFLQKDFPLIIFPSDYLSFLQIHDGFAKSNDIGIIASSELKEMYDYLQDLLTKRIEPLTTDEAAIPVDPSSLIPFYISYNRTSFQCFWNEWYPEQEMGNVYYSNDMQTLCICQTEEEEMSTSSFETFADWLMLYLEKIDI